MEWLIDSCCCRGHNCTGQKIRRYDHRFNFRTIQGFRTSLTGVLVIVDGAIALSGVLPAYAINAVNTFQLGATIPAGTEAVYLDTFISNATSVLIMTCQILFGLCLIKRGKSHTG